MKLTFRKLFCVPAFAAALACSRSTFAGDTDKNVTAENTTAAIEQQPFQLSAEFDVEQAYVGEGEVERGSRSVDNIDEYYSLARFVLTPRIPFGILRLGAEWERYSFGFSNGEQLPNTLQTTNLIVGLDTKFSDSILVRIEAQPGIYGTTFNHFTSDDFNVPMVIGGTYIYSPDLQFVVGIGVNYEQKYPVLPGGGVRWKFAPKWVLNAVLPTPRLEYQCSRNFTFFAGADVKTNTFRVDHRFGDSHDDSRLNNALVSYSEVRIGSGFEWKASSSFTITAEGGYLPYRNFDFYRADVRYHSEQGAPYASIALHGAF